MDDLTNVMLLIHGTSFFTSICVFCVMIPTDTEDFAVKKSVNIMNTLFLYRDFPLSAPPTCNRLVVSVTSKLVAIFVL